MDNAVTAEYFKFNNPKDRLEKVPYEEVETIVYRLSNGKNETDETILKDPIPIARYSKHIIAKVKLAWNIYHKDGLESLLVRTGRKLMPSSLKSLAKIIYLEFKRFQNMTLRNFVERGKVIDTLKCKEIEYSSAVHSTFIKPNAIIVSIGLDWDYSNYKLLYFLKQKIGFKFVGAFYDGIPITDPNLVRSLAFTRKFFLHFYYLMYLSDKIFTISDHSRKQMIQICNQFEIDAGPITETIHLGDSLRDSPDISPIPARNHKQKYVLYVSTVELRKNHKLLIDVWEKLLRENTVDLPDLIFVGMIGWGVEELLEYYKKTDILHDVVHFYTDVSDSELDHLYHNALFTVFPSFAEGWGLGAVESLLHKKPCIVSNAPALVEATQGLMPSLRYDSIEEWSNFLKELFNDNNKIKLLTEKIDIQFVSRSWEQFCCTFTKFASYFN